MIFWGEHHDTANRMRNNVTTRHHSHSVQECLLRATLCANKQRTWGLLRVPSNHSTTTSSHHIFGMSRELVQPTQGNNKKRMDRVEHCPINSALHARWTLIIILNMINLPLIVNIAGGRLASLHPIR